MAQSAISAAVGTVANLTMQETAFPGGVHSQAEMLKAELRARRCFLKDADAWRKDGDERAENWVLDIRDAAYQAMNILECINLMARWRSQKKGFTGAISRYAHTPIDLITLHSVGIEIEQLRKKIREMLERKVTYGVADLGIDEGVAEEAIAKDEILQPQRLVSPDSDDNDDEIAGFVKDTEVIVDELLDPDYHQLSIVSIVGMGGTGKSTLTSKVYRSNKVKEHFDTLAWVNVSQTFNVVALVKDIMIKTMGIKKERSRRSGSNATEVTMEDLDNIEEKELREKLSKFLQERRYLFVFDDVWTTTVWVVLVSPIAICGQQAYDKGCNVIIRKCSMIIDAMCGQQAYDKQA